MSISNEFCNKLHKIDQKRKKDIQTLKLFIFSCISIWELLQKIEQCKFAYSSFSGVMRILMKPVDTENTRKPTSDNCNIFGIMFINRVNLTLYPITRGFYRTLPIEEAYSFGHLVLSPGICKCSIVVTSLSPTCLVSELRASY